MWYFKGRKKYKSPYTGKEVDEAVAKGGAIPDTAVGDAGKALGVTPEGKIGLIGQGGSVLIQASAINTIPMFTMVNFRNNSCEYETIPLIYVEGTSANNNGPYVPTDLANYIFIPSTEIGQTLLVNGIAEIPYSDFPVNSDIPASVARIPKYGQKIRFTNGGELNFYLSHHHDNTYQGIEYIPAIQALGIDAGIYRMTYSWSQTIVTLTFAKIG